MRGFKKGRFERRVLVLSMMLVLTAVLAGCGGVKVPEDVQVSAVAVSKGGKVTAYIVEAFDKGYYSLAELSDMVHQEIADFNKSHGQDAAKVVSVAEAGDVLKKAVVILEFQNTVLYKDYMGKALFYGTVADAQKQGYETVQMIAAKEGTAASDEVFAQNSEKKILIAEGKVRVYAPGQPQYISAGAVCNEDGSVEPSDTEENTFIIMK